MSDYKLIKAIYHADGAFTDEWTEPNFEQYLKCTDEQNLGYVLGIPVDIEGIKHILNEVTGTDKALKAIYKLLQDLDTENDRLKTIIAYGYVWHKADLLNRENLKPTYVDWLETCKKIAEELLKED